MKRTLAVLFAVGFLLAAGSSPKAAQPRKWFAAPSLRVLTVIPGAMPGLWVDAPGFGYSWFPNYLEAEMAPWDLAPYGFGSWFFMPGLGWGWAAAATPATVTPFGWGFDAWYGGWYGMTPNGVWAGIPEFRAFVRYAPPLPRRVPVVMPGRRGGEPRPPGPVLRAGNHGPDRHPDRVRGRGMRPGGKPAGGTAREPKGKPSPGGMAVTAGAGPRPVPPVRRRK